MQGAKGTDGINGPIGPKGEKGDIGLPGDPGYCRCFQVIFYLIQKHPECKKERPRTSGMKKKTEIKMGGQGRCSVCADENKI